MTLRILNDVHIGAIRSSGTTPTTQMTLRNRLINRFIDLLPDSDLMILGDLFDKENIPILDILKTYTALIDWLRKGHKLYLVPGNHDLSKTSSVLSSFDFLAGLLVKASPNQVVLLNQAGMTPYGYVIPHVPNQDLFNLELSRVPACDYLFLHCNFDNNFAATSDQSLNLSAEQVRKLPVTKRIVIAHEHYHRQVGMVMLPGNQVASSVADWIAPVDKFFAEIDNGELRLVRCASRAEEFVELDYVALRQTEHPFVRVIGSASPEQASAVVSAIARFRQGSDALVITNAVHIQSADSTEEFSKSLEQARTFDVWQALKGYMTTEEMLILESVRD